MWKGQANKVGSVREQGRKRANVCMWVVACVPRVCVLCECVLLCVDVRVCCVWCASVCVDFFVFSVVSSF